MAYVNLVNQTCAGGTEEVFQRLRDFLCKRNGTYDYSATGIGWTLHDSSYAVDEDNCAINDWFVVKSVGESGDEDLYYKVTWRLANYLNIQGMLYWNAATDTGVHTYNTTASNVYCGDALSIPLWIYGDLDQFLVGTKPSATYYQHAVGLAEDLPYDTTVATSAGALSSGNDISITLDAVPAEWAVGRTLFIRDTANIDKITIKTLVGLVITADLAHNFLAGGKLVADLSYSCCSATAISGTRYCLLNHLGTKNQTITVVYNNSLINNCDPDEMNDEPVGAPITLNGSTSGYHGKLKNICRIDASISGVSDEDVYADMAGVNWRIFNATGYAIAVKEV